MTTATSGPVLLRGHEINGLPVVSIASGEALANVKDLVYSPSEGSLLGVTLNKRGGIFAGPLKKTLWLKAIHSIGRSAVMVKSEAVYDAADADGGSAEQEAADKHRNVIGNQVLTDAGQALGVVTDLIVEAGLLTSDKHVGEVVGYEVKGDEALQGRAGKPLLIPLPYTLAVSGTNLLVPASVGSFIRDDLSGFGAAVAEYRSQLDADPATVRARARR